MLLGTGYKAHSLLVSDPDDQKIMQTCIKLILPKCCINDNFQTCSMLRFFAGTLVASSKGSERVRYINPDLIMFLCTTQFSLFICHELHVQTGNKLLFQTSCANQALLTVIDLTDGNHMMQASSMRLHPVVTSEMSFFIIKGPS